MKKFNSILFIACNVVLGVIAFFSFNEAYARDDGRFSHKHFNNLLADFFNVMRFPTHVLFPKYITTPIYFALGLVINCLLYSFVIERTVYYIGRLIFEDEEVSE